MRGGGCDRVPDRDKRPLFPAKASALGRLRGQVGGREEFQSSAVPSVVLGRRLRRSGDSTKFITRRGDSPCAVAHVRARARVDGSVASVAAQTPSMACAAAARLPSGGRRPEPRSFTTSSTPVPTKIARSVKRGAPRGFPESATPTNANPNVITMRSNQGGDAAGESRPITTGRDGRPSRTVWKTELMLLRSAATAAWLPLGLLRSGRRVRAAAAARAKCMYARVDVTRAVAVHDTASGLTESTHGGPP